MLPQQLVLLVALALGSPWSSPVAAAPTSPLLAQPPSFALPVLGSGRLTGSDGDAGGQRIALSAHTLSQVAFGRGSSPGSSGVVTGQSGLRRRASSSNSDPVDDDAVWEALGWVQKGGCVLLRFFVSSISPDRQADGPFYAAHTRFRSRSAARRTPSTCRSRVQSLPRPNRSDR